MNENSQPQTPAISQWLQAASAALSAVGIPSARLDAELILAHTLRRPRTYLHAHPEDLLEASQRDIADARLALRQDRVPIAYIVGHKDFYGRSFKVTTATLIPRPESEVLIELLLELHGNQLTLDSRPKRLIDVGTGSGILGITAKRELPELQVTLSDISKHALTVAARNAQSLEASVELLSSNLLANYPLQADYVLANLPYVNPAWERSPETDHEPALALFAEQDGLALIEELLTQLPSHLAPGGYALLEADPEQHAAIIQTAKTQGLDLVEIRDYIVALRRTS